MTKRFTKLISSLLLAVYCLLLIPRPAQAFGGPFFYFKDVYIPAIYDDQNINLQKHIKETIMVVPMAMTDIFFSWVFPSGVKFVRDCLNTTNIASGLGNMIQNGANCAADFASIPLLADANNQPTALGKAAIASYELPAPRLPSTITFLKDSFSEFIPISHSVNAQGLGYRALNQSDTLTGLWKAFRNLAYALTALILIIMGLMIMFRVKLSAQAVFTVEQAIPQVAITLLLITFSFAIAGLAIDLTWILNSLFVLIINTAAIPSPDILANLTQQLCTLLNKPNCVGFTNGSTFYYDVNFLNNPVTGNVIFLSVFAIGILIWKSIAILSAFSTIGGPIIGLIVGLIFIVIAFLALIFNMFKIIFTLAKVYAQIIISIIFGPLVILTGALPQSQGGFSSWISSLLENVLALPVVSGMFLLGITLLMSVPAQFQFATGWSTPQIGGSPDLGILLAGFSILMAIPKVPDMLKAFFAKKPFDFATAIGESMKPGSGLAKGVVGGYSKATSAGAPNDIRTQVYTTFLDMLTGKR